MGAEINKLMATTAAQGTKLVSQEAEIARLSLKVGILTTESENYPSPKRSHGGDILADTELFKNKIRSDDSVFEMMYEIVKLAQKNMVTDTHDRGTTGLGV